MPDKLNAEATPPRTAVQVSVKGFGFLDMDELRDISDGQETAIEVYAKPTDFRRRRSRLSLLSVKPLYLHLRLRRWRVSRPAPPRRDPPARGVAKPRV